MFDDSPALFFSYNDMRKTSDGHDERAIGELFTGDQVSYRLGMNYRGPQAIDVVLVNRAKDGVLTS